MGYNQHILDQFNVVLVSFYDRETAKKWINDVRTNFPMYIDSDYAIYKQLGYKSIANVKAKTIVKTFIYIVRTYTIPTIPRGDISTQAGGNLIITKEGKVLYFYRSERPDDRPSVEDMLQLKH